MFYKRRNHQPVEKQPPEDDFVDADDNLIKGFPLPGREAQASPLVLGDDVDTVSAEGLLEMP